MMAIKDTEGGVGPMTIGVGCQARLAFPAIVMALVSGVAGLALAAPARVDLARIDQIEAGLLPAVVIQGEPPPTRTLADRMAALHVPGVSIAVFDNDRILWAKAYGQADVAHGVPVTPDTLFQAASISKPLAAMAALRLVQEGRLNLDTDVNDRLKAWKVPGSALTGGQKITLRRLLSHTAGLTVHGFQGYSRGVPRPTLVQVLKGEAPANSPPVVVERVPGSGWAYSGGGFTVVQLMMEEATGQPFADLMRDSVLGPVGMSASTYVQPLPENRAAMAATGYRANGQPVAGGWNVYPEQAAAGLWTTPSDLARWAIDLRLESEGHGAGVLRAEMARDMLTGGLGEWSLGLNVPATGLPRFGHGGANEGFRNTLLAFTGGARQGLVIMTNSDSGGELAIELERAVAIAYGWGIDAPRVLTVLSVAPEVLAAEAGDYEIRGLFKVAVTAAQGRLYLSSPATGDKPVGARMTATTRFVIPWAGLTGEFRRETADGPVTSLVLITPQGPFTARRLSGSEP